MSKNSPSARKHRALRFLAHLEQYKRLGPLIGPKEAHQPASQWAPPADSHASVSPEQTPTPADDSAHSGDHSTVGETP